MMRILIKPLTKHGREVVLPNLQQLEKIFSKPALRFTMKAVLPKKLKRGVLSFNLETCDDGVYYIQKDTTSQLLFKSSFRKKIFKAIDELIFNCEGKPSDVKYEVKK